MERRYLVAALAIVATFTGFSHGFRSLQRMSFEHSDRDRAISAARCLANSAVQKVAQMRAHLRHDYSPEQAQLLAEMNLPLDGVQSTIAEQMARQDADFARCARQRALEQAERMQRQAVHQAEQAQRQYQRMQQSFVQQYSFRQLPQVSVNLDPEAAQRIEARTEAQLAKGQADLARATENLANIEIPAVDVDTEVSNDIIPNVHCKVKVSRHSARDAMHRFQYGFTSK